MNHSPFSEDLIHSLLFPVDRIFYKGYCLDVAEDLLGKLFVKNDSGNIIAGKIVEVEAYDGMIDEASHSYRGITNRNKVMFYEGGHLYVYFTYGVHYCANIVTGNINQGQAVLISAVEPLVGIDIMSKNRFGRNVSKESELINLTNGPGKICKSFGINLSNNGIDLCGNEIFVAENHTEEKFEIIRTERIGIRKAKHFQWRFYISGNRFVSNTKN